MHRLGAESCSPPVRLGFPFGIAIFHQSAEIHLLSCGRRAGIGCLAAAAMRSGTTQQPAHCSYCAFHRPRRSWRYAPPHWGKQQRRGMATPHATGVKPRPHHAQVHFSTARVFNLTLPNGSCPNVPGMPSEPASAALSKSAAVYALLLTQAAAIALALCRHRFDNGAAYRHCATNRARCPRSNSRWCMWIRGVRV